MINLIIHPAFPKTGSSYLTNKLFKRADCNLLAKPYPLGVLHRDTTFWKLFKENYIPDRNRFKRKEYLPFYYLREKYKNYLIDSFSKKGKTFVLSDSEMLGDIQLNGLANLYLFKEIIDEIVTEKQIQIKIKFIITLRNQFDYITSWYNFFHKPFEAMSLETLMEKVSDNNDNFFYYYFEWTSLVKSIKKIFNCEFLLLPLEKLETDPEGYKKSLENFLNIKIEILNEDLHQRVNANFIIKDGKRKNLLRRHDSNYLYFALSNLHVRLKKSNFYQKKFRKSKLLNFIYDILKPKPKFKIQKPLRNKFELKKKIFETYSNSNRELARITGADLKKYNYY